jgi:hypothetical protein
LAAAGKITACRPYHRPPDALPMSPVADHALGRRTPAGVLDEVAACAAADPDKAAEALRSLDPGALDAQQRTRWASLLNRVVGERLGRWSEAQGQLHGVLEAQEASTPGLLCEVGAAAKNASVRADAISAARRLSESTAVPLDAAQDAIALAAVGHRLHLLDASDAATELLSALAPFEAVIWSDAGPLDNTIAAILREIGWALLERSHAELEHPILRTALARCAALCARFNRRSGSALDQAGASRLRSASALALGESRQALRHADAGLALLAEATSLPSADERERLRLQRRQALEILSPGEDEPGG